jgi:hypothetical protein
VNEVDQPDHPMLDPTLAKIRPTIRHYLPNLHRVLAWRRPIRPSYHYRHRCCKDSVYEPGRSMRVFALLGHMDWVFGTIHSTLVSSHQLRMG